MRAFFAFVLFGLVALVAGSIGYQAGLAANVGDAGRVIYWGGGPGLGTLLFLFVLFALVMAAFRPRRHWGQPGSMAGPGHWGPGHWGPGRWGSGNWGPGPMGDPNDPRRSWVADAHRRLHEEEARHAGTAGTSASTTAATPDGGGSGPTAA